MSGECKSYRLNEPMTIVEFKAMPVDLQRDYINLIRQKWNTPVSAIGKMLGMERAHLSKYLREVLGFDNFPHGNHTWDKKGFMEWAYGIPAEVKEEPVVETPVEETPVEQEVIEEKTYAEVPSDEIPQKPIKINLINAEEELKEEEIRFKKVIPTTGSMTYEGLTFNILSSLADLLGNANVVLSVKWDVVEG